MDHSTGHAPDPSHGAHDAHAPHGAPAGRDLSILSVFVAWAVVLAVLAFVLKGKPDAAPWMILGLPLFGYVALALFGDAIKRDGEGAGATVLACLTIVTSFVLAVLSVKRVLALPAVEGGPHISQFFLPFAWIEAGSFTVSMSLLLDNLSSVMALVVSGVGSLIHIYSLGYMGHDEDKVRYFSYLNLFSFFMLLLVLGGSLPLMFVGWEGVGLCSYLLIGFWFKKKSAADAGKKAFIVNRIGDAGLILGMILAFHTLGTLDLNELAVHAGKLTPEAAGHFGVITAICLLLFVGACGKSAQIPLHVWLPDAMEGPTPVSALIHAATMVTAGVYMVARLAPLYSLSATALTVVAVVGTLTAVMGATIALVQTDIKKVLAYSTVSQLGYMFLACGVGAFGVAVFHLFTHAFFKALLFLGSGSVIHALSGEQDMSKMGGLRKRVPWTFWTFVVGTAAIAGIPFLAGFYSKDAILAAAFEGHHTILFVVGMITALLTAFYMSRLLFLTFFGEYRGDAETAAHIHESPASMLVPLVLLAVGSIGAGYIDIPHFVEPVFRRTAEGHAHHPAWLPYLATLVAVVGIAAAFYLFVLYTDLAARLARVFRVPARVLENKYGFDTAYDWLASRGFVGGSRDVLWRGVDAALIDGFVNGSAGMVDAFARTARHVQSGLVRGYALLILGGAVALFSYLLWM